MAIFDQIIGSLTGESSLRRIRDRSIQAGRSAYDPTVLNPQIGVAQQQAVQGIDEGAYRRDVINQLFRPVSSAVYGGNQAAAIAGASAQDMARTRALGTFESQLAQQDIQAKQAGAEQLGKLQSSQLQLQGQRDSYTQQVNAEYEATVDSRRRQLGTALVGFGVQAAGGAGAIGGAIGNKFQSIFGKIGPSPQDIVQSGANMAAERSLQMATEAAGAEGFDFGALDFGDNLRIGVKDQGRVTLRDVVNRGMQAGARTFDANNPIPGMPMPFSVEDPGDFPRWTPPSQAPRAAGARTTSTPTIPSIMGLRPIGEYGSFEEYDQAQRAAAGGAPSYQAMQMGQARAAGAIGSVAGAVGRGFWAFDQFFSPVARGRQLLEALSPEARRRRFEEQQSRGK
jgi:hypothetical protein